ncbi:hypothetical protein F53441_12754 [Fusarium austroafricanum]|uniref:Uncharacterized protein n=1 Tax=Fusarium austroafricanum TaxID=2364996 RepID=A0A8H4JVD6_9HYPO|nr:hypothetical protein F53441_12754 [Fusarium austroafricanum]
MAHRNNNRHGHRRAHGYRQGHLSTPGRHTQFDVEHATTSNSSYIFINSGGRRCRAEFDTAKMSAKKRLVFRCVVWFGLLAAVGFLGYIFAYHLMAVIKIPDHTSANTPAFTLYKNSQFESCVKKTPQRPINCTLLEADLDDTRYPNLDWIGQQNRHHFMSGPEYQITNDARDPKPSWCDLASCLDGWKVIPSTPRQSAFRLTAMKAWMHLLTLAVPVLWTINKMLSAPKKCNKIDPRDWIVLIWEVGQAGFWWWGFGTLVSNPDTAEPVSLVAWVSTWKLATSIRFHPFSCFFNRDSKTRRGIIVGLNVLTFIQWAATIHALRLQDKGPAQKYDCLAAGIASAPGSSTCTAERLCSTTWLFQNPDFMSEGNETSLKFYEIMMYYQIVIYPLLTAAEVFTLVLNKSGWQKGFQVMQLVLFLFGGYLGLVYSAPYFTSPDPKLPSAIKGGLATVAYDYNCRAVHVGSVRHTLT